MTGSVGFCPNCGAPRPAGAYICPRCDQIYPGVARSSDFRDGFLDWVWRGVALGCGFLLLSVIASLVALLLLNAAGAWVSFHP